MRNLRPAQCVRLGSALSAVAAAALLMAAATLRAQDLKDPSAAAPAAAAVSPAPVTASRTALSREVIDDGRAVRLFYDRGDLLDVEAVYPVLPGDDPAVAQANATIAAAFAEPAADLVAQYDAVLAEDGGAHIGNPWAFSLGYQGIHVSERLVTVDGGGYVYTGGAHGGAVYLPLTMARRSGERLAPAALFRPHGDWLTILARHSRSALADQEPFRSEPGLLTDDWFQEGTAPTAANYGLLLPTADGIRVTFGHYQIGPYAIGDFHVTVAYQALRDVLHPALFPQQAAGD
mgnify:CR=1 FL=1